MLVNPSKIYVNINNKAVILLLMAIYNKNQATVSQNHKIAAGCQTKTTTCFSREHRICKHHQIQESWLNIIGLNRPPTCHVVKIFQFPS